MMRQMFSLIELLITVAVIAILAGLLLPALNSARQKGQAIRCVSNLKQQGNCHSLYAADFDDWIIGEQGDYGLYVKTVNGITADYDKDGTYWAFSVNGELSQKGVDQTYVKNGDIYTFTVTK